MMGDYESMKFVSWDRQWLTEVVELWNKVLGNEFPMCARLFEQNSFDDENVLYEGSQIALDAHQKVIGFIVAKKWQEQLDVPMQKELGWIQVLMVDQQYHRQGIGSKLLLHAEQAFKKHHCKEILLGRDPWHYFPGIPQQKRIAIDWFKHKGYQEFCQEHDLICHYSPENKKGLPNPPSVKFSILQMEERDEFLAFLNKCFPGRWEYEAIHYFKKGGMGREFVIMRKAHQIIGFSRINDAASPYIAQNVYWSPLLSEPLGGIGPLGIDADERGKGYGIAIVQAAISYLRKRNINDIVIDWTTLTTFYGQLGYKVWKSYDAYRKII